MRQRIGVGAAVLALAVIVMAGSFYRLPVVALSPGPAENVLDRISVQGAGQVYDSKGALYLTSVGIDDDVRLYEALLDFANRDVRLERWEELYPAGRTVEEIDAENAGAMTDSKQVATVVALRALGHDVSPNGAEVAQVVRGAPADGRLWPGDRILAVDGREVADSQAVQRLVGRHRAGTRAAFRVRRGSDELTVRVRLEERDGKAVVGIFVRDLFDDLPVDVTIDTGNINGPSAGLMFALSIVDRLTPNDLTAGRNIAGTGQITIDGRVWEIDGIGEKMIGARRRGAELFLVPAANCAEAEASAPPGLRLVRVGTVAEALRLLRQPVGEARWPSC